MKAGTKVSQCLRGLVTGMAALLLIAAAPIADAAEVCFTAFGGSVHYQFKTSTNRLKAVGTKPIAGRVFGALAACAGLTQWPITGTAISRSSQIILGFRAMTVDAAACGAVDLIVDLDPATLSGPLQLHNDRNNGSNTSTLVPAACINPLALGEAGLLAAGQADVQGNVVP